MTGAVADPFASGEPVLVGDGEDPVVFVAASAARIDAERLARVGELAGGMTVLGVGHEHAGRLSLAPLRRGANQPVRSDAAALGLEPCTPVDAALGLRGGWSLRDRARTMRTAAAPGSVAADLTVPGHVHPARIGTAATPAATAALELSRFAGRTTAVVLAPVSDRDGAAVTLDQARSVAALRRLPWVGSLALRAQAITASAGGRTVDSALPTRAGAFRAVALDPDPPGATDPACLALVHGDPAARTRPLVRLHAACPAGDVLGSRLCDCRDRLHAAMDEVVAAGAGVVVYVRARGAVMPRCTRGTAIDLAPAVALLGACGIPAPAEWH